MAFISSFAPALRPAAFSGAKVCRSASSSPARVSMANKSPSMPFMDTPASLSADMPGYAGFDPLNISSYMDVRFLQEAEIKHGRICMLAFVGLLAAELYTFPFYTGAPKLAIYRHDWGVTSGAMTQILLWCSFFEIMTMPALFEMINGKSDRTPGDFMFDPLGFAKDPTKASVLKTNEIKNGRLAMCAVSGAIHHAAVTHQNLLEQISSGNFVAPQF